MNPITQQMIWLIEQGLYTENLRKLIGLADQLALSMPTIYVTLGMIFRALADEYNDQGIETTRYNAVIENLQDPLVDLLKAEGWPADLLLEHLNAVLRAFHALR